MSAASRVMILPDLRVFTGVPKVPGSPLSTKLPQTREEALTLASVGRWLNPKNQDRARSLAQDNFDELFLPTGEGFMPAWLPNARQAITWETGAA